MRLAYALLLPAPAPPLPLTFLHGPRRPVEAPTTPQGLACGRTPPPPPLGRPQSPSCGHDDAHGPARPPSHHAHARGSSSTDLTPLTQPSQTCSPVGTRDTRPPAERWLMPTCGCSACHHHQTGQRDPTPLFSLAPKQDDRPAAHLSLCTTARAARQVLAEAASRLAPLSTASSTSSHRASDPG